MNRLIKIAIPVSILLLIALFSSGAFASSAYPEKAAIDSFILDDSTSDSTTDGYAETVAYNAIKANEDWFVDIIQFNFDDGSNIKSDVFYYAADNSKGYQGYYLYEKGVSGGGGIDKVITAFCPGESPVKIEGLKDCTRDYSINKKLVSTEVIFSHKPGDGKLPDVNVKDSNTAQSGGCTDGKCNAEVKENTPNEKESSTSSGDAWWREPATDTGETIIKEAVKENIKEGAEDLKHKVESKDVLKFSDDKEEEEEEEDTISDMTYDERVETVLKYMKTGDMTEAGFVDCLHTYLPEEDFDFKN